jgi:DNA-directed RNA polymerase specialized sigma24 family protein
MNNKESRAFLKGEMDFTPQRMMRYIRSRARIATDEDIEDILQNALVLVTKHFDPSHPEAKLAPYCLGACNKAIAQNLERYHKMALKKREAKVDDWSHIDTDFEMSTTTKKMCPKRPRRPRLRRPAPVWPMKRRSCKQMLRLLPPK